MIKGGTQITCVVCVTQVAASLPPPFHAPRPAKGVTVHQEHREDEGTGRGEAAMLSVLTFEKSNDSDC